MASYEERYAHLNDRYREEGWGTLAEKALGIQPINVESQARSVARFSAELLRELRDYAAREIRREGAHHDPIWQRVCDALGD